MRVYIARWLVTDAPRWLQRWISIDWCLDDQGFTVFTYKLFGIPLLTDWNHDV